MNIILTGMRGAGKSTVGKILSKKLNKDFIDLDTLLEKKLKMKIADIVKKYGWDYFRKQESIIVKELNVNNAVVATGGGVILKKENVDLLKRNGIFIYLETNLKALSSRIDDNNRPSLVQGKTIKDELSEVFMQRKEIYENTADIAIETDNLNEQHVANEIIEKFEGLFVIIGAPVEHSLSPKMHNAAYKFLKIDNKFSYIRCHVDPSGLEDFIKDSRKLGIKGICTTIPHKSEVIKYIDEIDGTAKKIGAVNTIVNVGGVLKGYNTDWIGIFDPLEKITSLKNKKVTILGAGGAARAAVFAMVKDDANVTIHNRTLEKAEELAKEFGCKALPIDKLNDVKDADIVINTTSVGLHPNEDKSPLSKNLMSKKQIIFDVVYSNKDTKFIKDAKTKGAKTISGIEMLLHQGFEQFKLFTGLNAPEEVMRKAIL